MPGLSGMRERRSAVIIRLVGANLLPSEQYLDHSLMSKPGGKRERCLAEMICLVGIDLPLE